MLGRRKNLGSCKYWIANSPKRNAGAWAHIPHWSSTVQEHSVPSVRTQTDPPCHGWLPCHINANSASHTVPSFLSGGCKRLCQKGLLSTFGTILRKLFRELQMCYTDIIMNKETRFVFDLINRCVVQLVLMSTLWPELNQFEFIHHVTCLLVVKHKGTLNCQNWQLNKDNP